MSATFSAMICYAPCCRFFQLGRGRFATWGPAIRAGTVTDFASGWKPRWNSGGRERYTCGQSRPGGSDGERSGQFGLETSRATGARRTEACQPLAIWRTTGAPARGPFLIVTPPTRQTPPGQVQPARPAPRPADPEPRLIDPPAQPPPAQVPDEPILEGPDLEPLLGEPMPGEPTYEEPDHHEPPRLVDPPASAPQKPAPQKPEVQRGATCPGQAATSTGPRPKLPSLAARSADRLAELNGPPPRGRGGCLTLLLILAILAVGGYWLWRAGKLDPVLSWARTLRSACHRENSDRSSTRSRR